MEKLNMSKLNLDESPIGFVAVLSINEGTDSSDKIKQVLPKSIEKNYVIKTISGMSVAYLKDHAAIKRVPWDNGEAFLLGNMVSEIMDHEEALPWTLSQIEKGDYSRLKTLQGVFALIVLDKEKKRIIVVSDLIGIYPIYHAEHRGTWVISDRAEAVPRLGQAELDKIGFAGWMYFGKPISNRTMFKSVYRMAPASVSIFEGKNLNVEKYWHPVAAEEKISNEELIEATYSDFILSLKRLTKPFKRGTVLLSGGYDSRFCLLSILQETDIDVNAVSVPYNTAERQVVDQIVKKTKVECDYIEIQGSVWDIYESIWYRHPDGYVRWRNLSFLCAKSGNHRGVFIDGSHSDVALRRSRSGPEEGRIPTKSEALDYIWKVSTHHKVENYFKPQIVDSIKNYAKFAAEEQGEEFEWGSKYCKLWNILADERRNIAFNHIQYNHFVSSIQPFLDRSLIERRLRHPNTVFTKDSYRSMLGLYFPGVGDMPHSDDIKKSKKGASYEFSRYFWTQIPKAMKFIFRHKDDLKIGRISPGIIEYSLGVRRHLYVLHEIMRFVKLEEELNHFNIELDFKL